ncbi:hypothetical protein ACFC80_03365 [Enterococcus casseliflavus]|uniref:hypothetical protein n=1 Tax=Enterococcus casseliflavus TaxID=37734 RepID=UPI0039A73757
MLSKTTDVMHGGEIVNEEVKQRLMYFLESKREGIVYRGVSNEHRSVKFTTLISDVGEKGKYFRQTFLKDDEERFEKLNVNEDKMNDLDIKSHANNSSKVSKYVSTSKNFDVAKEFACMVASDEKNSYIILAYYDKEEDNARCKVLTPTHTDYSSENEVTFFHAIFADRIIGVFSLGENDKFSCFNINPNLYKSLVENEVTKSFYVDQSKFDQHKKMLGYKHETWKNNN